MKLTLDFASGAHDGLQVRVQNGEGSIYHWGGAIDVVHLFVHFIKLFGGVFFHPLGIAVSVLFFVHGLVFLVVEADNFRLLWLSLKELAKAQKGREGQKDIHGIAKLDRPWQPIWLKEP